MKLTRNFSLKEFTRSDTATRLGIDNTPSNDEIENIQLLCEKVLQPLRNEFGPLKINSGYRCVELCEAIGSNKHSNHVFGFAADIETYDETPNVELLIWIHENLEYKELIGEYFGKDPHDGWVHVAYQHGNNKRDLKLKDSTHNYERVDIDVFKKMI